MRIVRGAMFVSAFFVTAPVLAATCESIAALKLPTTTITAAQVVAAGAFRPSPPPSAAVLKSFESLPAFCRVQGVIQPSSDSHIEFEVWLPMSGWNGKYFAVGNGGGAGTINYGREALPARLQDERYDYPPGITRQNPIGGSQLITRTRS
jgi:hypothetical protein